MILRNSAICGERLRLRLRLPSHDEDVSPSADGDKGSAPLTPQAFKKA